MPSLTAHVVEWYAERLQRKVQKKSVRIREIQAETGRTMEQVLEIHVYAMDVSQRDRVPQDVWIRRYRFLRDGTYDIVPPGTRADCRIFTDLPTVTGIAMGHTNSVTREGAVIAREEFTVYDALRLGHIDYDGNATALRNLNLLQKKLLPEIARELKLIPDTDP